MVCSNLGDSIINIWYNILYMIKNSFQINMKTY